jgi:hypothetical protein
MRIAITIDDDLYKAAFDLADPSMDQADLLRETLELFVRVQSAHRLADKGGKAPQLPDIPRRRPGTDR